MVRLAGVAVVPSEASDTLRGDLERGWPLPLAFAFKKGEAVRFRLAGVPVREGGLLGRLIAGLSQEEKKSSLGSPAGVLVPVPSLSSTTSSTVTSFGDLSHVSAIVLSL